MIATSIPRGERELGFYIADPPRTDCKLDMSNFSLLDGGHGNGSRIFSNALHDREAYRLIRLHFSKTPRSDQDGGDIR